jgi:predicted transcriptional regulator
MAKTLIEICTTVVAAQASRTLLSSEDIATSLHRVFQTLKDLQQQEHRAEGEFFDTKPSQDSIQRNRVLCLECGKAFKLLSNRHLALHGLTPREYKQKHGIRMTQPLSARTLSARRSKMAQELGMGKVLETWRATNKQHVS